MKDIDFLPLRYHEQRALRKAKLWQLAVVVLFGLAVCSAAAGQYAIRRGLKRQMASAAARHGDAEVKLAQVSALRLKVDAASEEAELVTHLRSRWPQTQLLADIVRHLPESLVLTELTIAEQKTRVSPQVIPLVGDASPSDQTPARRDLDQLRKEHDAQRTVILLNGIARDGRDLHAYVATLRRGALYEQAKLESMESVGAEESERGAAASFLVRVLVLPSYGQGGRFLEPPVNGLSQDSKQAARKRVICSRNGDRT